MKMLLSFYRMTLYLKKVRHENENEFDLPKINFT